MHVELLKLHTHAGVAQQPGAVIALDDDLARWLVDTGVARVSIVPQNTKPKPHSHTEEQSQ
ncbi:MAG: hypothetical protein Q8O33_05465 [Pseudomonadota bacterium]|nr:hypothetical protein [Pseudomonadota bacterium]